MNKTRNDLLIIIAGTLTSFATALVIAKLGDALGLYIYGFTLWVIVPVGAIGSGLLAASGYYIASRLLNARPTKLVLIGSLVVSLLTYGLIQWLEYTSLVVEGRQISNYVLFVDYWKIAVRSMEFKIGRGASSGVGATLGNFGYVVAILQIVGFGIGGLLCYGLLKSLKYCENCGRYFANKGSISRHTASDEDAKQMFETIQSHFDKKEIQFSIDSLKQFGDNKKTFLNETDRAVSISAVNCKGCNEHEATASVKAWNRKDYEQVKGLEAVATTTEDLVFK